MLKNLETLDVSIGDDSDATAGNAQMPRRRRRRRGGGRLGDDRITYPQLLNILDGALGSTNGLLIIITTTNFDKLRRNLLHTKSEALLRPGRVHPVMPHFDRPTSSQMAQLFTKILGDDDLITEHQQELDFSAEMFASTFPTEVREEIAADGTDVLVQRSVFTFAEMENFLQQFQGMGDDRPEGTLDLSSLKPPRDPKEIEKFRRTIQESDFGEFDKIASDLLADATAKLALEPTKDINCSASIARMLCAEELRETAAAMRRLDALHEPRSSASNEQSGTSADSPAQSAPTGAEAMERLANVLEREARRLEVGEVAKAVKTNENKNEDRNQGRNFPFYDDY